jgi:glycosyltransferase involved in cell wall biosynthesis
LNIINQLFQYSVDDELLAYLYQNAICFVFPSLYEGFGIPILESFACKCPAVISNSSSLPEVGGNAVIYFNPNSKQDIYEKVNKIVYDENLRKEMVTKGLKQLEKFSWQKTSEETFNLYRSVLN